MENQDKNKNVFPYHNRMGKQVQAKGYSVFKKETTDYMGNKVYEYAFLIVCTSTNTILYSFTYTGTVAPE